jgi:CheY-like chemotaxis protein
MGSGTVLVVDDEEIVRGIAESMLQKLGFQVLTAANGQDALTVIYERHAELAAVLLDMTMPVFSGVEVFRELRRKNIRVPLVFTSGYNKQQEVDLIPTSEALVFLQKPYRLDAMRETFRNLLTARPPV